MADHLPAPPGDELNTTITVAGWSAPLPPPSILRDYEDILPGSAERVFAQFEEEAQQRRDLTRRRMALSERDAVLGQVLAGLYAAGSLGATVYAAYLGAEWVAAILGGGTIVGGIVAFLKSKSGS